MILLYIGIILFICIVGYACLCMAGRASDAEEQEREYYNKEL